MEELEKTKSGGSNKNDSMPSSPKISIPPQHSSSNMSPFSPLRGSGPDSLALPNSTASQRRGHTRSRSTSVLQMMMSGGSITDNTDYPVRRDSFARRLTQSIKPLSPSNSSTTSPIEEEVINWSLNPDDYTILSPIGIDSLNKINWFRLWFICYGLSSSL